MFIKLVVSFALTSFLPFPPPIDLNGFRDIRALPVSEEMGQPRMVMPYIHHQMSLDPRIKDMYGLHI
jgi:hypothetical protein